MMQQKGCRLHSLVINAPFFVVFCFHSTRFDPRNLPVIRILQPKLEHAKKSIAVLGQGIRLGKQLRNASNSHLK